MDQQKQELIAEVAAAALTELEKMEKRHIQVASPRDVLKQIFAGMIDPQPAEESSTPVTIPVRQVTPDDYPKLKVKYGAEINLKIQTPEQVRAWMNRPRDMSAQGWIIVQSPKEEEPFQSGGWYTAWPVSQPASRPQPTMESIIERLEADGVQEFKPARKANVA